MQNNGVLPRLIVLAPSHYGERARWALDHAGIAYREERWAPGPHAVLAKRLVAGSSTTTPILDLPDGAAIQGSDRILDWTGMSGGAPDLERRFERRIGPLVRQCLYAALLGDPRSGVREMLLDGVAKGQAFVGRLLWPVVRRAMVKGLDAGADRLPALMTEVDDELAWFDDVIGARGRHLVGGAFGRADITAASLLAPVARPPASPVYGLYAGLAYPPAVEEALSRWSARPSLTWARDVYAERRRRSTSPQAAA